MNMILYYVSWCACYAQTAGYIFPYLLTCSFLGFSSNIFSKVERLSNKRKKEKHHKQKTRHSRILTIVWLSRNLLCSLGHLFVKSQISQGAHMLTWVVNFLPFVEMVYFNMRYVCSFNRNSFNPKFFSTQAVVFAWWVSLGRRNNIHP